VELFNAKGRHGVEMNIRKMDVRAMWLEHFYSPGEGLAGLTCAFCQAKRGEN
jgi:hypothetical protein